MVALEARECGDHPGGHDAVAIIGDQDRVAPRGQLGQPIDQPLLNDRVNDPRGPRVEPEEELRRHAHPSLDQGSPRGVFPDLVGLDPALPEELAEPGSLGIRTHDREEPDPGAERVGVDGRVRRTTRRLAEAVNGDDRHGRLATEPRTGSREVGVEHGLAEDDDLPPGESIHQLGQVVAHQVPLARGATGRAPSAGRRPSRSTRSILRSAAVVMPVEAVRRGSHDPAVGRTEGLRSAGLQSTPRSVVTGGCRRRRSSRPRLPRPRPARHGLARAPAGIGSPPAADRTRSRPALWPG